MSSFHNVTRIEIVNIDTTSSAGMFLDYFGFDSEPSFILAWNDDDNGAGLHTYIIPLTSGDVTPRLYDGTFDAALDQLGDKSTIVNWGDSDRLGDGGVPHFYDSGKYNVSIDSEFNGSPVTSTFVLDIGHTPNPVTVAAAPPLGAFVALGWTPVDGALGYEIYRGLSSNGSDGSLLTTVTSPDFADLTADPETSYYYRIVADFPDGTTLDLGVVGAGSGGGTMADAAAGPMVMAPAAAGTPRVTRLGTATQADVDRVITTYYSKYQADAAANNAIFVGMHDVVVLGREIVMGGSTRHLVTADAPVDFVANVRKWDTNVYLSGGGANDASIRLRGLAAKNKSAVQDLGGGKLTATLQDGTVVTSQPDGTWGKLIIQRPASAQILVRYSGPPIRELNFSNRRNDNNNIDRIDSLDTIVEEKDGTGLMNPRNLLPDGSLDYTEAKYSAKEIFGKMDKRLALLNGLPRDGSSVAYLPATRTFKSTSLELPYSGPDQHPTANELRRITKVKFEVKGNWPALKAAVNADIARLQGRYRGYTFSVSFAGN